MDGARLAAAPFFPASIDPSVDQNVMLQVSMRPVSTVAKPAHRVGCQVLPDIAMCARMDAGRPCCIASCAVDFGRMPQEHMRAERLHSDFLSMTGRM
jgi:hypothetical protein